MKNYSTELLAIRARRDELVKAQDLDQAIIFLESQKEKFFDDAKFQSYLVFSQGVLYSKMEDYESAINSFEESYRLEPEEGTLVSKAMALWKLGKREEAKAVVASIQEPIFSDYANAWLEKREGDESS